MRDQAEVFIACEDMFNIIRGLSQGVPDAPSSLAPIAMAMHSCLSWVLGESDEAPSDSLVLLGSIFLEATQ